MEKYTIEFIKFEFEKESYRLLTKKYINTHQKLDYICPNNHEGSISWNSWNNNNSRCFECAVIKRVDSKRLSIDLIRPSFNDNDHELLTEKYINSNQKLDCICPKGHVYSITWGNWRSGGRCPYCSGWFRKNIEFIRLEFEKENYILLTKEYINNAQRLEYICPVGHERYINWNNWQQGKRCPTCYRVNNIGPNHPNWKDGIICEPYCEIWLDKEYKEDLRARDNHQCQNPGCWGTSELLRLHHIDYNKKNCDPNNLITLCNSCNSRSNFNREYWMKFYRSIMIEKHRYVYKEI